ncbi:FAIM family protein [Megaselia abdita]
MTEASEGKAKTCVVAEWRVPISGMLYKVEFEHGKTSGKRVIWVNGNEVYRNDWMFKLVGDVGFLIDNVQCIIRVIPAESFKYEYHLVVGGKILENYIKQQEHNTKTWISILHNIEYRVVFDRSTQNVFLNGVKREEKTEFVDGGTDTVFHENNHKFIVSSRSSGVKNGGILFYLLIDDKQVPEALVDDDLERATSISC